MKVISDMICLNSKGKGEKINHKAKKKNLCLMSSFLRVAFICYVSRHRLAH